MSNAADLLTAGKIAQALGVSDAKVKKAIAALEIEPAAQKGACKYYTPETVEKVKGALG